MKVHPVRILPLKALVRNPDNPKKPLGQVYSQGLEASLREFGLSGCFNVAENSDGTFEILDGNTRDEILDRECPEVEVGCIVHEDMGEGKPDWRERRREFALTFDRHKKLFDEDAVVRQLRELAAKGRDVARLAKLSGMPNLRQILQESANKTRAAAQASLGKVPPQKSLTLYGPAEDVDALLELVKRVKGRVGPAVKLRISLEQAEQYQDMNDEQFLLALASAVSRVLEADGG